MPRLTCMSAMVPPTRMPVSGTRQRTNSTWEPRKMKATIKAIVGTKRERAVKPGVKRMNHEYRGEGWRRMPSIETGDMRRCVVVSAMTHPRSVRSEPTKVHRPDSDDAERGSSEEEPKDIEGALGRGPARQQKERRIRPQDGDEYRGDDDALWDNGGRGRRQRERERREEKENERERAETKNVGLSGSAAKRGTTVQAGRSSPVKESTYGVGRPGNAFVHEVSGQGRLICSRRRQRGWRTEGERQERSRELS